MKQAPIIAIYFLLIIYVFSTSCTNEASKKNIVDFSEQTHDNLDINNKKATEVYIAIASMTSPKETFIYYHDLINYISKKVGYPIYIKQKRTYEEVNKLIENGEVDFAFICSGAFAEQYKKRKVKLLVAPQIENKTSYNAYIITYKGSDINSFKDFKNKSFAFTDPLSNTGRLYPLHKLALLKRSEKDFFMKSIYTYAHDVSIQMVNREIIDGASVHGLIFEYIALNHPEKVSNIKIIEKSENFGMPPVVVPSSLSKDAYNRYKDVFLNIHKDSIGKDILKRLNIDKFVFVDDEIYNSVFELKEYTDHVKAD